MPVAGQVLYREGWDLANGSAWPAPWTPAVTGVTADVQSARGRFVLNGSAGGYNEFGGAGTTRVITTPDFELVSDVVFSSTTAETYCALFVGDTHNIAGEPFNGVGVMHEPQSGGFTLQRYDGTVQNDLSSTTFGYSAGTVHRVRIRRDGPFAGARIWTPATSAEPSTWMVSATEHLHRGGGHGAITAGMFGGNAISTASYSLDTLEVWELHQGRRRRAGAR